jgi:molybdopterin-guanine dinucleotide biosynthesis protein B
VVSVCLVAGPSGSGKTTLVERLVGVLAARGIACATAKHHRGAVEVDRPGKDSWRHRRAGARATFLVTDAEVTAFLDRPADFSVDDLVRLCPGDVRLLLVEGFKGATGHPRVEVVRREVDRRVVWTDEVLCVATDVDDLAAPCPVFGLDDAERIADLLVQRLLC